MTLFDNATRLDEATENLKRAKDLINIFIEYTGSEGFFSDNMPFEERKTRALVFAERHSMFEALIYSAFDIIKNEEKAIDKISDELFEMSKKGERDNGSH